MSLGYLKCSIKLLANATNSRRQCWAATLEQQDLEIRVEERTLVASPDYKHAPRSIGTETTDMRTLSTSPFVVNGSTVMSRITRVREGNLCFFVNKQ
jgi:hypothetical protein